MPYTYLIGWKKINKFYYGARWAKNCNPGDLWVTYFTSSKHVKHTRDKFGEPDVIQIRKTFNCVDECRKHELKVLKRLNVLSNDKWLNKNISGIFLPYGPQTKEHVQKRTNSRIKNKRHLGKVAWTKETHPEYALKVSNALKGKKKTPEHVKKMKLRYQNIAQLSCPHCKKNGDYKNMKRWHMDNCKSLVP
jgi:hypothetical protein